MYDQYAKRLADSIIEKNPPQDGDYLDDEGLLVCGKCNTRKRKYVEVVGTRILVPVHCKCMAEAYDREKSQKHKEEAFEKVADLRMASIVDDKFRDASFDTCTVLNENARQVNLCRKYAADFERMYSKNQGLLLYGNVGTGKSHVAACICNELMKGLTPVYATSFVKVLEDNPRNVDTATIVSKMKLAHLVLFDDLGAERKSDYGLEVVYNLIDSRYRQRKPMIVTTNLSLKEMQTVEDRRLRRIYDRVMECCYPVLFDGQSFRLKEAAKRFDEMSKLFGG